MLNNITLTARTQLRRLRAFYLLALISCSLLAMTLLIGGAWEHALPAMLLSPVLVPLSLRARHCYRCISRNLRMLGA